MNKLTKIMGAAALVAAITAGTNATAKELDMTSVYPGSFPIVGDIGKDIGRRVSVLTGGDLGLKFHEPGALVPAPEAWDAVSTGAVDAAWYSPGFAQGIIPSAAMFTSVPFGPEAPEYLAWYYFGDGDEIWNEITAGHNIKSILCATLPPEASGWFRNPINSVEDLKGMKMRFFGLGARVMEKLGVSALTLPVGDTVPALELGTIDAAEVSMPALDLRLGMQNYAKHYYFPGWHQQTSLFSLLINLEVWNNLQENEQFAINEVCRSAVAESVAWGEAIQFEALKTLESEGVVFHRWSPEILEAMEASWAEVVEEQSAADADFKRVWDSYSAFRSSYAKWRELGYMR
ncbi:MAG: TRAP transporter substrate-binding protein [Proteobacteria bacterium]|nr:TRAP transporter substrate-binding protein [Pseudomonadota bacterium]